MNVSICLDQYASNYNLNALSSNGFSVYTDLDNFTTPIAQGIPYQNLFSSPIGNCPYLLTNVPAGATQLLVIDSCTTTPLTEISTPPTSQELLIDCCYALIDIPQTPPTPLTFCASCSLDFDVFSSSYVGQIVAGNLTSTCGTVTDYTIGWYKDGDYSSPVFTSGYGTSFLPYQNTHPLTGNQSVPATAGNWEGIIHDIAINGTTYSSVSGSAGGQPIPFETCFGTIVVDPLTCNNGPYSGSSTYSHQINYNGLASGTSSAPVSFTYTLSPTTKYFAVAFQTLSVWDEIEIKWKSGNPAATNNPSLYSQPIYLEKLRMGLDAIPNNSTYQSPSSLYIATYGNSTTINPTLNNINNVWPKLSDKYDWWQKTFTLTNLETSSNPSTPDYLEITITPNPTNNNTQWNAGFQCLDDFDCEDCQFSDWPNSLSKIKQINLKKQYGCDKQRIELITSGCVSFSDWMGYNPNLNSGQSPNSFGINQPNLNLIGSYSNSLTSSILNAPAGNGNTWVVLKGSTTCNQQYYNSYTQCGPSSTGTITYNSSATEIQITFNTLSDYLYIKDDLIGVGNSLGLANASSPLPCNPTPTNGVNSYYSFFSLRYPVQSPTSQCGDGTSLGGGKVFNSNDYLNIVYTENPLNNFWSITIPRTQMVNCNTYSSPCSNCNTQITDFVSYYNSILSSTSTPSSYTTYTGAKYTNPFQASAITLTPSNDASGSLCTLSDGISQLYYWYSIHTIPFISSSTSPTGWVNLPSLGASIPCYTGSYYKSGGNYGGGAAYYGFTNRYKIRFPHLTSSFNYSLSTNDFEIYSSTGFGNPGSLNESIYLFPPPCPDPLQVKIYSYSGSTSTVYTSSYFVGGVAPIVVIDP